MATSNYKQPKKAASANAYGATKLGDLDISIGAIDRSNQQEKTKTDGIKIRGTGAATKGIKARGPMA